MNVSRQATRGALRFRQYATAAYVPPASMAGFQRDRPPPPPKPKPESPTFYTGRSNYYDQLLALESATKHTRTALQALELLPLPKYARENLPPLRPVWKNKIDLAELMSASLTTSRYRRFITQLNQLNEYRRLAEVAGHMELASRVQRVLDVFERNNKEAILAHGKRKPVKFDEFGRSYTIGRRKESTARVWVIATQTPPEETNVSSSENENVDAAAAVPPDAPSALHVDAAVPDAPSTSAPAEGIAGFTSGPLSLAPTPIKVPTTSILINNIPLAEYL